MSSRALDRARLRRLHDVMAGHVERGEMPGLVALVSCRDEVHADTIGSQQIADAAPMRRDTIFRIASLTKPVTATAALILIEEGRLRLDDSIEPWLPELAGRHVLCTLAAPLDDTVPARRAITLRDLLTLRMGFGSVMTPPGTYPIQAAIRDLQIGGDGPPRPGAAPSGDEWLRRLGSLPLMAQPGERWLYHVGSDVLGMLVARASGKSLGAFLRERIFEPLGMNDTAFCVPQENLDRFSASYGFNRATRTLEVYDDVAGSAWRAPPPMESGGGGLVGTVDDYFAFCRMLLNHGRSGSERILSRAAVELMTSDQLAPQQREGAEIFFGAHSSWGMGVAVDIARTEIFHSPGRFGWTGGLGATAYTDPANGMIGILFTPRMMDSPDPPRVFTDFWTLAYAALD